MGSQVFFALLRANTPFAIFNRMRETDSGSNDADSDRQVADGPVLEGIDGLVNGESFPLEYGQTVIVGRSRSCEISLRRCPKWLDLSPADREKEKDLKTVSRKHVRVSFYNANSIEIEDLSSNGTFVDGKRIDRLLISDIKEKEHDILLGTRERLKLIWRGE
mgnify:CR=1 FL=1